jgi:hypothetical protein
MEVFLKNANPDLWGTGAHRTLIDTYLPLLLYHDLTGTGYNKMEAMLEKGKERGNIGHHSMDNNSKVLRKALEPWANAQIELGSADVWNEAQSRCHFPDPFKDTNIWVDSTDFRLDGKSSTHPTSDTWSFKLNAPGRRYMLLSDANRRVRKIYGGYTPKLHDGSFLEANKAAFASDFRGARVVADGHFSKGKKLFGEVEDIKFYIAYRLKTPKKGKKRKFTPGVDLEDDGAKEILTTAHKKFNKEQAKVRSRVESIFGWMKEKFQVLKLFREGGEQMDFLVNIALAVHNRKL